MSLHREVSESVIEQRFKFYRNNTDELYSLVVCRNDLEGGKFLQISRERKDGPGSLCWSGVCAGNLTARECVLVS